MFFYQKQIFCFVFISLYSKLFHHLLFYLYRRKTMLLFKQNNTQISSLQAAKLALCICVRVCMCVCMHVYVRVCVYACVCMYACVYLFMCQYGFECVCFFKSVLRHHTPHKFDMSIFFL